MKPLSEEKMRRELGPRKTASSSGVSACSHEFSLVLRRIHPISPQTLPGCLCVNIENLQSVTTPQYSLHVLVLSVLPFSWL